MRSIDTVGALPWCDDRIDGEEAPVPAGGAVDVRAPRGTGLSERECASAHLATAPVGA